uniref:Uncharacterized protein n=1 Tax=Anopheles atroparvus TaxID=41427 RepID=A0A182IL31_ANOAO
MHFWEGHSRRLAGTHRGVSRDGHSFSSGVFFSEIFGGTWRPMATYSTFVLYLAAQQGRAREELCEPVSLKHAGNYNLVSCIAGRLDGSYKKAGNRVVVKQNPTHLTTSPRLPRLSISGSCRSYKSIIAARPFRAADCRAVCMTVLRFFGLLRCPLPFRRVLWRRGDTSVSSGCADWSAGNRTIGWGSSALGGTLAEALLASGSLRSMVFGDVPVGSGDVSCAAQLR